MGRDEDAERLIPELPLDTVDGRFDRAWTEVGQGLADDGRAGPHSDGEPAAGAHASRTRGEIDIAVMRALAAAGAGRPLTTLPRPPAAPLAIRWSLPVWWQRCGLVWRALFGFALGSATAVLIVR